MTPVLTRRLPLGALALLGAACSQGYSGDAPTCPPGGTVANWSNTAGPIFERYCTRCHSSDYDDWHRQGAASFWNYDDLDTFRESSVESDGILPGGADLGSTWDTLAEGSMPPMVWMRPTTSEILALGEWLACGAPE